MNALRTIAGVQRKIPHVLACCGCNKFFSTETARKEPEEIKIPVPWGHIAGRWWGPKNQTPLLALHGWQDNAGSWDTLIPLLDPTISVLAIDTPGHGLSSHLPPGIPYYGNESVLFLRRIMKYFGWETVSLLGHSFGAAEGFIFASAFPDKVDSHIALDALKPWSLDMSTEPKKFAKNLDKFLDTVSLNDAETPSYTYEEMIERLHEGMIAKSVTKESCEVLLKRGIIPAASEGKYNFRRDKRLKIGRFLGWTHHQLMEMTALIKCRVLFIKAMPGLKLEPENIIEETLNMLKKSSKELVYKTVEGTHHVHLNNPERVAPIINEFLAPK
ncbi:probable serine hydrolase isoform X3 [Schistocerca cancellata]|uniref:probable serine hydrolase isoform X3 n=1 Tax=Schistocerca cancellata TaxID=274614 RepID=UPI002118431F|nr:probable serine hydrolase isoform X3 [Schistocerca cancellata]